MSTSPIRKQPARRAQVALEFVLILLACFVLFAVMLGGINKQLAELSSQRDAKEIRDVTNRLRGEIFLASIVQDGYYRDFRLPEDINDKSYSLEISNGVLTGRLQDHIHRVPAPNVTGTPKNGLNIINRSVGGIIYLN